MSFAVSPEVYWRFMGRFADPLAERFVALLEPQPGQRAVDIGCGTGILTARLVERLGEASVSALDPSRPFVESTQTRFPAADVRLGLAEELPWDDASHDLAGAQLVVHFMQDPVAGLREMLRVTRPGGRVAACVWDHAGDGTPLATFWRGAHEVDPAAQDESDLAGSWEGHLSELLAAAGGRDITAGSLAVEVAFDSFEEWWEPYTLGVGPAGAYVAALTPEHRDAVRERCRASLPAGSFTISATAWSAVGLA